MATQSPSLALFAHVANRPEDDIELDVAALLVAEWEYDNLDVSRYVAALDDFAERTLEAQRDRPDADFPAIRALHRTLFRDLGFRGNEDNYYDPRNSFLHQVIERRTGLPITLSVLYIEVARRIGLEVRGVSFPGHFLVRHDSAYGTVIIDPFHLGRTLDSGELDELAKRACGPEVELDPDMLAPASKRDILLRILANLSRIYEQRGDIVRARAALERMQVLDPSSKRIAGKLDALHAGPGSAGPN